MARAKGFQSNKIAPFPRPLEVQESSGAFTSEATAKVRTEDPLPEEAGAGNTRVSSTSDFGADVSASADQAASTELP